MSNNLYRLYNQLNLINKKEFFLFEDLEAKPEANLISLRYRNAFKEMQPEAVLCLENEPFMLFFDVDKNEDAGATIKKIHKQAWNFDKAPVIIISSSNTITFYNAFDFDIKNSRLSVLTDKKDEFENFSYESIYSGKFFDRYSNSFQDHSRVDKQLLNHITGYRDALISLGLEPSLANNLLARTIFLRYLKDRDIRISKKDDFSFNESFSNKKSLYDLFRFLKSEFNGDLFDINIDEENAINKQHIDALKDFFNNTLVNGQMLLFPFDFSIIPIELVSNIYEIFLNSKRKINKSYYTPTFLVDYIINKTVSPFLSKSSKKDSSCKILDPACGSGIFLIESLRKIIKKEESLYKNGKLPSKRLQELIEENIFGIDKDEDAINIAIFSLYITLLDYQDPRSILSFRFPKLKNTNFFHNDSFNKDVSFVNKIKNIKLDFIISNPPYGSIKTGEHIEWYEKNKVPVNDYQIAQSFLAKVKDFSSKNTKSAMIVTSTILYNEKSGNFRKYFLENFRIKELLELSAVRNQIFNKAVPPVSILFYDTNNEEISTNVLKHISLKPNLFFKYFKVLMIEKNDEKSVEQTRLVKYDWLWKILLYGNILDFHFIKRLKSDYKALKDEKDIYHGQGIVKQCNGREAKYSSEHLIGLPFLDTTNKALQPFYVDEDNLDFELRKVYRVNRDSSIFKAPATLVKRGVDKSLSCVSAFSDRDLVFTNSVCSIKSKSNDTTLLKSIVGMLNSNLANYLVLYLSALAGVEREEMKIVELLKFPVINDYELSVEVDTIQNKAKKSLINERDRLRLNCIVEKALNINEEEKDLIDYAKNVSIPIWKFGDTTNKQTLPSALKTVNKEQILAYADIFYEAFSEKYKNFNIDVYTFEKCTLMNFKARQEAKTNQIVSIIRDSEIKTIVSDITQLSVDSLSNEIFTKKDIKGFNRDSFFIIKTNEYKNWHRAIARLDVNEFIKAIMEAEFDVSK